MQKERDFVQHQLSKSYSHDLLASPLRISYDFYFEIPKSYSKKKKEKIINKEILHTTTPDCSNCVKMWEDCLKGVIIEDDRYVVESIGRKHYSNKCQVVIKIDLLTD
jgi:Holliday junction resolvase RusA-like endonuclease